MSGELEAYVDAAAAAGGLTLDAESRAAVAANLVILRRMAALFEAEPADPHADPLTLFRPPPRP